MVLYIDVRVPLEEPDGRLREEVDEAEGEEGNEHAGEGGEPPRQEVAQDVHRQVSCASIQSERKGKREFARLFLCDWRFFSALALFFGLLRKREKSAGAHL